MFSGFLSNVDQFWPTIEKCSANGEAKTNIFKTSCISCGTEICIQMPTEEPRQVVQAQGPAAQEPSVTLPLGNSAWGIPSGHLLLLLSSRGATGCPPAHPASSVGWDTERRDHDTAFSPPTGAVLQPWRHPEGLQLLLLGVGFCPMQWH